MATAEDSGGSSLRWRRKGELDVRSAHTISHLWCRVDNPREGLGIIQPTKRGVRGVRLGRSYSSVTYTKRTTNGGQILATLTATGNSCNHAAHKTTP